MKYMFTLCLTLSSIFFSGCGSFFEDSEPETTYPPLVRDDLVGCWRSYNFSASCSEVCYSRDGSIYGVSISLTTGKVEGERLGKYWIEGGSIYNLVEYRHFALDRGDSSSGGDGSNYWINHDTLWYGSNSGGSPGVPAVNGVRSDSATSCKPRWNYFIQPATWDIARP